MGDAASDPARQQMRWYETNLPKLVDLWHREKGSIGRWKCIGEGLTWPEATEIVATRSGDHSIRYPPAEPAANVVTLFNYSEAS